MKRVLIISYYWPPAGGISPLRCLKIAKYLRKFDWEPIIYSPLNADYPIIDNDYLKDVPEDIEHIKGEIWEPFRLFKFLSGKKKEDKLNNIFHVRDRNENFVDKLGKWIRSNFFIPDARSMWIRPSVKLLSKYLKDNPVDAMFTDGPPHTNTMIGLRLKQKFKIPWLSDYQDPWTQVDYYKLLILMPFADRKHRKLENECLNFADALTIASDTWALDLNQIANKKVEPLYYGYDEEDFEGLISNLDNDFTIFHGGLLGYDRFPENLFQAIIELIDEELLDKQRVRIVLAGQVDYSIVEFLKASILNNNVDLIGTLKRKQVLQHLLNSQMILLPINKAANAKGRIPGKLFECLRARRPILCLGPIEADTSRIVEKTLSGKSFDYSDVKNVKQYILDRYNKYLNGSNHIENKNIEQYRNDLQTEKVANILNQITNNNNIKTR